MKIKLTFRIIESHTITRDVNAAEFQRQIEQGDPCHWLTEKFRNDPLADSDISTESAEVDSWSIPDKIKK
jgi:hypothetical protein